MYDKRIFARKIVLLTGNCIARFCYRTGGWIWAKNSIQLF